MRPIARMVTAIAFLLSAATLVNAADEPSKPFSKVTLDINTAGIEETLPFDIPFYFTGNLDDPIKRLELHLIERGRSASLLCVGGRAVADMLWQRRGPAPTATPGATPFQLFEPRPLKANQNYCLNITIIRSVADDVVKKFKSDGAVRVDTSLRSISPLTPEISIEQAEALRQELIATIADPATGDRLVALPGSIFRNDPRMTPRERDTVTRTFIDFLADAKQAQDAVFSDIRNLAPLRARAIASLQLWSGPGSVFSQLLDTLDAGAAGSPALAALLAPIRQELRDMAALSGAQLGFAIAGEAPDGSSLRLNDVWETAEFDSRSTKVKALYASLERARALVHELRTTPFNLPAEQRGQLETLEARIIDSRDKLLGIPDTLDSARRSLARRQLAIARVMNELGSDVEQNVSLVATTVGNFATRHAWYIGADIGLAVVPQMEATTPYIGTNIYFRPVNKNAPLTGETDSFSRRFSAMVGITVGADLTNSKRLNLFDSRMLLLGAGLRINDSLRVAGGVVLFRAVDPNPFVDNPRINYTWFLSGSVDWDVKGTFTAMGSKNP